MDTPKSGKTRTVDIVPSVAALLRELRQEQAAKGLSHFVFNKDGSPKPMHPKTPTRSMKKFAQRYGIEGLHLSKLRPAFSTLALQNGVDIKTVSGMRGHYSAGFTLDTYAHVTTAAEKKAGPDDEQLTIR